MNILIIDEDLRQIPQFCDLLRLKGNVVIQVTDWRKLEEVLNKFNPDLVILDLMMPKWGLRADECLGGYGTGGYVYKNIISKHRPDTPFVVYTGVDPAVNMVRKVIDELKNYPMFRGEFKKDSVDELISFIEKKH